MITRSLPLTFLLILCGTHGMQARLGKPLADHVRQRQELHDNLARIGVTDKLATLRTSTYSPSRPAPSMPAPTQSIPSRPAYKPTTPPTYAPSGAPPSSPTPMPSAGISPESLTEQQHQAVGVFLQLLTQTYGEQAARGIAKHLYTDHSLLARTIALVEEQKEKLPPLIQDEAFMNHFLGVPSAPQPASQPQPVSPPKPKGFFGRAAAAGRGALSLMGRAKNLFSVGKWNTRIRGFLGEIFKSSWEKIWRLVSRVLVTVLGEKNVYATDPSGKVIIGPDGTKQPKMVEKIDYDEEGNEVTTMVPNKWFGIISEKHSLLGAFAAAGVDRAVTSAIKSMDRLLLRPLAHSWLKVPRWKLSHTQYKLHMHHKHYPNQIVLNPRVITDKILEAARKNSKMVLSSGLKIPSLRGILKEKDAAIKTTAMYTKVTQLIWQAYEAVWQETTTTKEGARIDAANTGQEIKEDDGLLSKALVEGKHLAKAAGMDQLTGGPLMQYYVYANLAMSIPRTLFERFGTKKALFKPEELTTVDQLKGQIEILERVTQKIRAHYNKADDGSADVVETQTMAFTFNNGSDEYTVNIAPRTQKRLLEAQEKLVKQFAPFIGDALHGDEYQVYIRKLLFPRIVSKLLPKEMKLKLKMVDADGKDNLAKISSRLDLVEKHFSRAYNVMQSLTNLLSMIKRFQGINQFAGHYAEIADVIDQFSHSLSDIGASFGIGKDSWAKRRKDVRRHAMAKVLPETIAKRISENKKKWPYSWLSAGPVKAFNPTQRQKIKMALSKAGVDSGIVMLNSPADIKAYINGDDSKLKGQTFSADNATPATEQARVTAANEAQKNRYRSAAGQEDKITFKELKKWVNTEFIKQEYTTEQKATATERAVKVMIATLATLSASKINIEDTFYTDGSRLETSEQITANLDKFNKQMNDTIRTKLAHVRAGIEAMHSLYNDYGLREILMAFDEHYHATGEKLTKLPMSLIGKIVLREGMGHAVGIGAEKLLKKAMGPLLAQVSSLQGNPLLRGPAVQNLINSKLSGLTSNRGIAYKGARDVIRNLFTYGSTALKPENLMGTVGSQFMGSGMIPGMPSGGGQQEPNTQAIMHAKMAGESGREMLPAMAKKMKDMGMDPQMFAGMSGEEMDAMDMDGGIPGMPGQPGMRSMGPAPMPSGRQTSPMGGIQMSPALQAVITQAMQIQQTKGPQAMLQYMQAEMTRLSPTDRQQLMMMMQGGVPA